MRRLALLLVALAACLLLPATGPAYSEPKTLAEITTWLAQRPTSVHCLTKAESEQDINIAIFGAAAYVDVDLETGLPLNYTVFAYPWCRVLRDLRDGERTFFSANAAAAVLIITHESGHLRASNFPNWESEAIVNCWALRRSAAVAVLGLGMPEGDMAEFQKYLNAVYLSQPPPYHKKGCIK